MNSQSIHRAKHHGVLSPMKGPRGDMIGHRLGRGIFGGGARIPDADGEIKFTHRQSGDFMVVVGLEKKVFWGWSCFLR